jgi:hypothetical protein
VEVEIFLYASASIVTVATSLTLRASTTVSPEAMLTSPFA